MKTLLFIILSSSVLFGGCTVVRPVAPETGRYYYINPQGDLGSVARVVMLEPANQTDYPSLSMDITEAVCRELQKKHLFNITILERNSSDWIDLQLDKPRYSPEELVTIRDQLKADAILLGSISQYRPYPHMLIGLNYRMLDLRSGMIVWGMEQLWDSTDSNLSARMERFYQRRMRSGYEPMDWQLVHTSPRAFNRFVAYEVAQTFPGGSGQMQVGLSSENSMKSGKIRPSSKKLFQMPFKELKLSQRPATIGM